MDFHNNRTIPIKKRKRGSKDERVKKQLKLLVQQLSNSTAGKSRENETKAQNQVTAIFLVAAKSLNLSRISDFEVDLILNDGFEAKKIEKSGPNKVAEKLFLNGAQKLNLSVANEDFGSNLFLHEKEHDRIQSIEEEETNDEIVFPTTVFLRAAKNFSSNPKPISKLQYKPMEEIAGTSFNSEIKEIPLSALFLDCARSFILDSTKQYKPMGEIADTCFLKDGNLKEGLVFQECSKDVASQIAAKRVEGKKDPQPAGLTVQEIFTQTPNSKDKFTCNYCLRVIKDKTSESTNRLIHVQKKHPDITLINSSGLESNLSSEAEPKGQTNVPENKKVEKKSETGWKPLARSNQNGLECADTSKTNLLHFFSFDKKKKKYACTICSTSFSSQKKLRECTSKMLKHFELSHRNVFASFSAAEGKETVKSSDKMRLSPTKKLAAKEDKNNKSQSSVVHDYYQYDSDENKFACMICFEKFPAHQNTFSTPRRLEHLKLKHAEIFQSLYTFTKKKQKEPMVQEQSKHKDKRKDSLAEKVVKSAYTVSSISVQVYKCKYCSKRILTMEPPLQVGLQHIESEHPMVAEKCSRV